MIFFFLYFNTQQSFAFVNDLTKIEKQETNSNLDYGGNGQMSTLGLETVFISNVFNFIGDTIISNVFVRALDRDGFSFSTDILQDTFLFGIGTIAGFESLGGKGKQS